MRVFVLLFNVGTDNEGIHSIQTNNRNVVLMFEDEDDATRFSLMLEAQDFPPATIEAMDEEEIEEFCESVGYETKFLPSGSLAIPPENNVDATDWREDGIYVEGDRDRSLASNSEFESTANNESKTPSEKELDRLRQQLEKLL